MRMTLAQYELLVQERSSLLDKKEAAEQTVGETGGSGEWHDNAAWEHAQHEYALIAGRLIELEQILAQAEIIVPSEDLSVVQIGHKVVVLIEDEEEEYTILSPLEARPEKGVISYLSPLGQALLGKSPNTEFSYRTPMGILSGKILRIQLPE